MEFSVNKNDIIGTLSNLQGIASKKSNIDHTENFFISTLPGAIKIIATDYETGFEGVFPAEVASEGTIVINARKFYEIVRDFPSQEILVKDENSWIEIGKDKILYHLVGLKPDDFPEIERFENLFFIEVDSSEIKRMIDQTVFISPRSEERRVHYLGVLFQIIKKEDKSILRMVSTDGSRLSRVETDLDNEAEECNLLIPKKGLMEAVKLIEPGRRVKIGFNEKHIVFKKENQTISIRLLEGDFPDYERFIDIKKGKEIQLDRTIFSGMLKRMSILSYENFRTVIFKIEPGRFEINTTNPQVGESKEDIEIEYDGETIEVAFNPRFFIEALSEIGDDNVILKIEDEKNPCIVYPENDLSFICVIMPMRI